MIRNGRVQITLWIVATFLLAAQAARAQDTTPAPPPPAPEATPTPAPDQTPTPAAPAPAAVPTPAPETTSAPNTAPAAMPPAAAVKAVAPAKQKKVKEVYTGPTTVVTEDGTPMLDEEGKQMIDPSGKPMFNLPAVQMRDKKGHPVFDASGKPVFRTATDAGYDAKGKKIPVKHVKPPKMIPVVISRGTFTVDGMIGKAELNYTIPNFKFFYLYAPGIGTAIVSNSPFQGATVQKNAFSNNTLTVFIEDHKLQLASDKEILGKHGHPESAYVAVDRQLQLPSRFPVVGYGSTDHAPYTWPGSKRNGQIAGIIKPPPTPKNLLSAKLLDKCPTGQMRMPAPAVLPGKEAPEPPCVPITKALQERTAQQNEAPAKTVDAAPAAGAEAVPTSGDVAGPPAAAAPADAPTTPSAESAPAAPGATPASAPTTAPVPPPPHG